MLDDLNAIAGNPSLTWHGSIADVLLPPPAIYTSGRPLLNLSFALNQALGGTDVAGYHLVNLAIHALAVLALFGVVRRTLANPASRRPAADDAAFGLAFAAAALWAVHPLLTNSVTYLSQRAESLMGLCYLLTLYGFVRYTEAGPVAARWAGLSALACAGGMATKEGMVTAPVIVLLLDRQFYAGSLRAAIRARPRGELAPTGRPHAPIPRRRSRDRRRTRSDAVGLPEGGMRRRGPLPAAGTLAAPAHLRLRPGSGP